MLGVKLSHGAGKAWTLECSESVQYGTFYFVGVVAPPYCKDPGGTVCHPQVAPRSPPGFPCSPHSRVSWHHLVTRWSPSNRSGRPVVTHWSPLDHPLITPRSLRDHAFIALGRDLAHPPSPLTCASDEKYSCRGGSPSLGKAGSRQCRHHHEK